jgi:hypothetical protein
MNGLQHTKLSGFDEWTIQHVHGDDEEHRWQGSPCQRPRLCSIGLLGWPLSRIFVEAVESSREIQLLHLTPKPHCWRAISVNQEHLLYFGLSFEL